MSRIVTNTNYLKSYGKYDVITVVDTTTIYQDTHSVAVQ